MAEHVHQLVLVCWRAVPQTISFYNPEPSYLKMSRCGCIAETWLRRGCTATLLRRGCTVELPRHGCTTALSKRGCTIALLRCGCTAAPLQRWDMAALLKLIYVFYFCVVGSKPWQLKLCFFSILGSFAFLGLRSWKLVAWFLFFQISRFILPFFKAKCEYGVYWFWLISCMCIDFFWPLNIKHGNLFQISRSMF